MVFVKFRQDYAHGETGPSLKTHLPSQVDGHRARRMDTEHTDLGEHRDETATKAFSTLRTDLYWAAALFFIGLLVAGVYSTSVGGTGLTYGERFGPALMLATGHGFTDCLTHSNPAVNDFMLRKRDAIAAEETVGVRTIALGSFHREHAYLLHSIGAIWWFFGPSWSSLILLGGFFVGITLVCVYGLFRLCTGRALATLGTLFFLLAPFHLTQTTGLRDYSKVPFIMACLFLTAWLVTRPTFDRKKVVGAAAAIGLLIGLGRGFRYDVDTCSLFAIASIAAFMPGGLLRNIPSKAIAIVVMCAAIYAGGFGLKQYEEHRVAVPVHVIVQGLMTPFDCHLGVHRSFYDFGYTFGSDADAWAKVATYQRQTLGSDEPMPYVGPEHAASGNQYLRQFLKTFPADLLTRTYAAILTVLDEVPFGTYDVRNMDLAGHKPASLGATDGNGHRYSDRVAAPMRTENVAVLTLYRCRAIVVSFLHGNGPLIVAVAILLVAVHDIRKAIFVVIAIAYFGGIQAIQFHIRHSVHLQIFSIWALVVILHVAGSAVGDAAWRNSFKKRISTSTGKLRVILIPTAFALGVLAFTVLPLLAARWYQQRTLLHFFAAYAESDFEPLTEIATVTKSEDGSVARIAIDSFAKPYLRPALETPGLAHMEYLAVFFQQPTSGRERVSFSLKMQSTNRDTNDCSRDFEIDLLSPGLTGVFIPVVYYSAVYPGYSSRFDCLEVSTASLPNLQGIYRVKDTSQMPFALTVVMPENWELLPRYERVDMRKSSRENWIFPRIGGKGLRWPIP